MADLSMEESTRALVEVESPTSDVHACAHVVSRARSLADEWLGTPGRVFEEEGRPTWQWGPEHPQILLLGHLDTVWPLGTLEEIPFAVHGDRMTGPGVFDMKAGVVQGWAALARLAIDSQGPVGMLLTTDEETGSHNSRSLIARVIRDCRSVLVLEPSAEGALKTRRKGTSWYHIAFEGRAAHAGLEPERGVNATVEAAHFITEAVQWSDARAGTSVTPTVLSAGHTANTVPDRAHLTMDVRAWTRPEQERVDNAVRGWSLKHPEATWTITGGIDRGAMEETASSDLFALAQSLAASRGLLLSQCAVGGASDGNLTAAAGIPTLDGLGAVGDGAHAVHEWASISAMTERSQLVADIVDALLCDLP